jgi:phosphomannomutase
MNKALADQVTNAVVESAGGAVPALTNTPGITAENILAAKDAFTQSVQFAAIAAAVFLALGFLATFRLTSKHHGE